MRGLKVPAGILLPWITVNDGMVWGIKVRRAAGKPKYVQVGGGKISAGLYNAHNIRPGKPLLLTEGEFDCLLIQQVAGDLVNVATLGSATTKLSYHWLATLATCNPILACYDNDEAGSKGGGSLASLSARIVNVRVPVGKDPTDLEMSEPGALREWILSLLPDLRIDQHSYIAVDDSPAADVSCAEPTMINLAGWNADYRCPQHPDQWYYLRRTADGWLCAVCAGAR
jgi:DNA primase